MSNANALDLTGLRFGRVVVRARTTNDSSGRARWSCDCDCGGSIDALGYQLRAGRTTRCRACVKRAIGDANRRHGVNGTPTHTTWAGILQRCLDQKNRKYALYGGRGIGVCDRWRHSFEAFLADMGERPAGMSIDRIDNDRGYEPGNCRWATAREQVANRRCTKLTDAMVEEIYLSLRQGARGVDLAKAFGVSQTAICAIRHGRGYMRAAELVEELGECEGLDLRLKNALIGETP